MEKNSRFYIRSWVWMCVMIGFGVKALRHKSIYIEGLSPEAHKILDTNYIHY